MMFGLSECLSLNSRGWRAFNARRPVMPGIAAAINRVAVPAAVALAVLLGTISGAAAQPVDALPPAAPTNVRLVDEGDRSVTVAWDAPEAEEDRAEPRGYRVFYRLAAADPGSLPERRTHWSSSSLLGADARSGEVTDLQNGAWYEFKVASEGGDRSMDGVLARPGEGSFGGRPPGVPNGFRIVTEGEGSVTVTWEPPADDGGSAVTGYEVWYVASSALTAAEIPWEMSGSRIAGDVREHVVSGLVDFREYTLIVAAVNDAGRGPFTDDLYGIAGRSVLPPAAAPTNLRVVDEGDGSVTIGWDPPDPRRGRSAPGSYQVLYRRMAFEPGSRPSPWLWLSSEVLDADVRQGRVTGLTNGAWYQLRVASTGGDWTVETVLARPGLVPTDERLPDVPSRLDPVADGWESVTVAWEPPSDDGGVPVTGYEVWYAGRRDGSDRDSWVMSGGILGPEVRRYKVTGLVDFEEYLVSVAAVNKVGRGPFTGRFATANTEDWDPLKLIVDHRVTKAYSLDTDTWEVWTCDVADGTTEIDLPSIVERLNREIPAYFGWLSGNRYRPVFVEAGTVKADSAISSNSPWDYGCEEAVAGTSEGGTEGAVIILDKERLYGAYGSPGWPNRSTYPENRRIVVLPAFAVVAASEFCKKQLFSSCPYRSHVKLDWVAHEMAHAISWPHSFGGRQFVNGRVYAGDNPMDLMSNNPEAPKLELNALVVGTAAMNRYAAGWIDPEEVAVHREPYGSYLLSPPGVAGVQMLVLSRGEPGRFISLGARVAKGHDGGIPAEGVEVYRIDQRAVACSDGWPTPDPDELLCIGTDRRTQPVPPAEPDARRMDELLNHVYGPGQGLTVDGFRVEIAERLGDRFRVWVGNPYEGTFADDDDSVHESNIERLVALGVTQGCDVELKLYCPHGFVTRAQMAKFLVLALGERVNTSGRSRFTDVADDAWYRPFVERLADLGITTGYSDRTFRPDEPVTRAQMAVFLTRAFDGLSPMGTPTGFFSDVPATASYAGAVEGIRTAGITRGCSRTPGRNFCPGEPVRRDQIASLLTRAIDTSR